MLRQSKLFLIFMGCTLVFFSCKNTKKSVRQEEPVKPENSAGLASNEAFVAAKVVSISEQRDESGPCSKAPCYAEIKIESISKKGSLFQLNDISNPLSVTFAFSLSATEGLFRMKTNYPGLKINDKFEAKIQSRPALGDAFTYTIHDYKKIN